MSKSAILPLEAGFYILGRMTKFTRRAFKFSVKTTVICLLLAGFMLRMSYWQWTRHLEKQELIKTLTARLEMPVVPLKEIFQQLSKTPDSFIYRRVAVEGEYDFKHEVVLRNRRLDEKYAGVNVLTPIKLNGVEQHIMVDRGFIPLAESAREQRTQFQKGTSSGFVGLIKETHPPKFFQPSDPATGPGLPWVDAWLRADIENIRKQLPYFVPTVYLEIVNTNDGSASSSEIVASETSGKDDMLFMANKGIIESQGMQAPKLDYPISQFTTIIPPGRHLGYVYEWAFMALLTLGIGFIVQCRRTG